MDEQGLGKHASGCQWGFKCYDTEFIIQKLMLIVLNGLVHFLIAYLDKIKIVKENQTQTSEDKNSLPFYQQQIWQDSYSIES